MARHDRLLEAMMPRTVLLAVLLIPLAAWAQTMPGHHHGSGAMERPAAALPVQPGQGAFAAIQEIVAILETEPATDWSRVNIGALRQHLIDMDNVTLHAEVTSANVDGGVMFTASGRGAVRDSIRRMVMAHAASMSGAGVDARGWQFVATTTETGATLTVKAPAPDIRKLRGLGFIGVMTHGMHHQVHHLTIARGGNPHH